MELRLPPGYYLERDPDIWTLRRSDGSSVAAFSARGVVAETIEGAAWEDPRREQPPAKAPRPGRDRARCGKNSEKMATWQMRGLFASSIR